MSGVEGNPKPNKARQKTIKECKTDTHTEKKGGGQNLKRQNLERAILRNFKIANIKITKDELFDNFICESNFSFFRNHLNTQNI